MATTFTPPRHGCTAALRFLPDGGYTDAYDAYEVVCCACGDDPTLDYREVPPRLQRLRGPYWLAPAAAALEMHLARHGIRLADPAAASRLPAARVTTE